MPDHHSRRVAGRGAQAMLPIKSSVLSCAWSMYHIMLLSYTEYPVHGSSIGLMRNILCYYWSAVAMDGSGIDTVHYIPSTMVVPDGVAPVKVKTFCSC